MIHRLMIIALEDVGPNHIGIFIELGDYIQKINECREKRKSETLFSPNFCKLRKQEFNLLVKFVLCCCLSSKSRECSYYKYLFNTCLDEYQRQQPVLEKMENLKLYVQSLRFKKKESDFSETFDEMIKSGKDEATRMAWIWSQQSFSDKHFNSRKSQYYILFRLQDYISHNLKGGEQKLYSQLVKIFVSWTKELGTVRENFLPWECLLISLIKHVDPNEKCNLPSDLCFYYNLVNKNLDGDLLIIDDYVKDMHTKEGKRMQKGPIHFAEVSSVVVPEDRNINQDYKKLYTIFKYEQEGKLDKFMHDRNSEKKKF
jgi:hypothetical protein